MKITAIETFVVDVTQRGNWIFVRLQTDAGITGIGEASQGGNDVHTIDGIREITPMVIGHNPFDIEAFHQRCYRENENRPFHTAVSGIEHALWDIVGKTLNAPVYNLLGGRCRDTIRIYANINRATWDRSPESFARNAAAAVEEGFTAIKCAPFDGVSCKRPVQMNGPDTKLSAEIHRNIDTGIARIRQVRSAIGDTIDLLVDCHGRFSPDIAIQVTQELKDVNLFWFEDPIPATDFDALARVKSEAPMPIAFGETLRTKPLFREANVSATLLKLRRKWKNFLSNPWYLDRFDAFLNGGVQGCRAGRALFNIDSTGDIARCVESRFTPVGNLFRDHPTTIFRRLRAASSGNTCTDCWYNCRGEVEALYNPYGLATSLPTLLFDRGVAEV